MPKAVLVSLPSDAHEPTKDATTRAQTDTGKTGSECGFGKRHRLNDAAAFRRVFRRARRSKDAYFTVLFRPNGQRGARLGLAIAKKQCPRAYARNRLKRLVRESFRNNQQRLFGVDAVVLCTLAAPRAANPVLFESLERHWQRVVQKHMRSPGR